MMDRGIFKIFLLGLVAVVSSQQLDPIVNFCRRIDHQCKCSWAWVEIAGLDVLLLLDIYQ